MAVMSTTELWETTGKLEALTNADVSYKSFNILSSFASKS